MGVFLLLKIIYLYSRIPLSPKFQYKRSENLVPTEKLLGAIERNSQYKLMVVKIFTPFCFDALQLIQNFEQRGISYG